VHTLILIPITSYRLTISFLKILFFFFLSEDEGYISHNPVNSIGQSNGNHDLARTILEVGCYSLSTSVCAV